MEHKRRPAVKNINMAGTRKKAGTPATDKKAIQHIFTVILPRYALCHTMYKGCAEYFGWDEEREESFNLGKFIHAEIMELESITYGCEVLSDTQLLWLIQFHTFANDKYNDMAHDFTAEEWIEIDCGEFLSYQRQMFHVAHLRGLEEAVY